jgi:lipase chaperone LimK
MSKQTQLISILAAFAVSGGLAYWLLSGDETEAPIQAPVAKAQDESSSTIAHQWQWKNFSSNQPANSTEEAAAENKSAPKAPYNVVDVYKVLQSIKLDEYGRLVPDQTALQALENGFNDMGSKLTPEAMKELQEVIRSGLPGPAGEEAAQILENYYRFRFAEIEFNEQQASRLSPVEHHKELVQLRRSYLGKETADQLFAVEDAQANHMLASIAIQRDDRLTAEEKQTKQAALQEQLNNRLLAQGELKPEEAAAEKVQNLRAQGASSADIYSTRAAMLGTEGARELAAADQEEAQWKSRFNGFWQARRYVMQAGLDEGERTRQIEELLSQYFNPEDRERARITSAEWQARDAK